jgi:hypothetical protein
MKRTLMIVAMLAALMIPVIAGANDREWMPPEWTPTPPARQTIDANQLASLLVEKGMLTRQDYAQLTPPPASSPAPQGHGRVWTWGEIDTYQRSPLSNQGD